MSAVGPTGSDHLWKHLWDSATDAVAVLDRQGQEIPLEVTLCRLEAHADGQGEPLFAAFIRDITQRRLIEKRLEAQREVLEKIRLGRAA